MLLFLAVATSVPPSTRQAQSATVTMRVLESAKSSRSSWDNQPASRKKEIIVQEKDGRQTRVRLIEFE